VRLRDGKLQTGPAQEKAAVGNALRGLQPV
jgi:hypothetical protein